MGGERRTNDADFAVLCVPVFFLRWLITLLLLTQKWKRENDRLPKNLQRPLPEKPSEDLTHEEWNQYAWETAQVRLSAIFGGNSSVCCLSLVLFICLFIHHVCL